MDESGLLARLRKNIKLVLLIVGLLLLPIIYFAANTQTNLFSRASTPSQNGFVVHRTDPMTGEFFDLIVSTTSFKIVNENNIANKSNVTFRISGDNPRLILAKNLYGAIRQSKDSPYIKTFNFVTEGTGAYITFTSDTVLLDQNNACIDLHSDPNRTNYVATYCYKLSYFSPTSTSGRIYSYYGNPFIESTYTGTKPAGVISMTTAFDKNSFKGIRVNYFSQDQETNSRDFKNLTYVIQGLTSQFNDAQYEELCSLDAKYPEKYLRFGRSFWYEGGELIQLTERGPGGCSFQTQQTYLIGGWMNIWHRNMFLVPTPSQTSPVPISISLSKTPTPLPSIQSPTGIGSTAIIKPCVPKTIGPSGKINTLEPTFSWQGCPGNTMFYYKIFVTGPTLGWNSVPMTSTSYKLVGQNLKIGSTYYWYVKSCTTKLCNIGSNYSQPVSFNIVSSPTGVSTMTPTRTPTPKISNNPSSYPRNKAWIITLQAQCPAGQKIKTPLHWYSWDSSGIARAGVTTIASISGISNKTFNLALYDNTGPLKPKTVTSGLIINSTENYVTWSGSLDQNPTIVFETKSSTCVAQ